MRSPTTRPWPARDRSPTTYLPIDGAARGSGSPSTGRSTTTPSATTGPGRRSRSTDSIGGPAPRPGARRRRVLAGEQYPRARLAPVPPGDPAQVDRLVVQLGVDPGLERDRPQRAPGGGRLPDDIRRPVVADGAVEGRGHREGRAGGGGGARPVDLDAIDAPLGEHSSARREQVQGLQEVAGDQGNADVELELALQAPDRDRRVVADHLG